MDTVKILTGEAVSAAVHALNDQTRRQILHALRARRMSTSDLCEFLAERDPEKKIKPQTVRYHLKELESAGLVEQDGYAPAGNGDSHIQKKIWRATAENIFIATGDMDGLPERANPSLEKTLDLVAIMKQIGFHIPDDEVLAKLANDFVERDKLLKKGRTRAKATLSDIPAIDPGVYLSLRRILSIIQLGEHEYDLYWELTNRVCSILRDAYKNGVGKNPEVY
ncbi:MAG: helix-turn-helix domain-containing protein [Candidatus Lokiarchaeota archaeon]|nr:helix-turn-helix domain-containing protein [Candidatus Lokiarchaeota archaeon]